MVERDQVREVVTRRGAALCWADRLGRPVTPLWATADWGYVRVHQGVASPLPSYGRTALSAWLDRIDATWRRETGADVFVFFNNDRGGAAVRNARTVGRMARTRGMATATAGGTILNHMVQYSPAVLDRTFSALADAHRRQILDRLGTGPVSISELAVPLGMSLPGVLKHVRALEEAQFVETHKRGRTRWCQLGKRPLDGAAAWIDERRALWEGRIDRFERHLQHTKAAEQ